MKLTPEQVGALWVAQGGPADEQTVAEAIAVSWVESRHETTARSRVDALGLFQLHPPDQSNLDPTTNVRNAIGKYEGGTVGWQEDWFNWWEGDAMARYHAYMPRAHIAARRVLASAGGRLDGNRRNVLNLNPLDQPYWGPTPNPFYHAQPGGPDIPDFANPLDPLAGIEGVGDAIRAVGQALRDALDWITSSETWLTVGKILAGAILTVLGLRVLYMQALK